MNMALSMKITLFLVFCLVCVTGAFAQSGSVAYMVSTYVAPEHPMHAAPAPLSQGQSLFTGSGVTIAQGELPLWEVAPKTKEIPLGDRAREERKEHATAKKARVVWEN
jgi:hypothetical protein